MLQGLGGRKKARSFQIKLRRVHVILVPHRARKRSTGQWYFPVGASRFGHWHFTFHLSNSNLIFSQIWWYFEKKIGCCKKPQGAEVPFCFHCKVLRPAGVQLINHHFSHYCLCKLQRKVRIYSSIPTLSSGTKLPYLSPWIATNPRIF